MRKIAILLMFFIVASFAADSLNVRLLGRYTPCSPLQIAIDGNTAYLANSSGGLQILDVTNPAAITSPGYLFLPGDATELAIIDDHIAMACSDSTLRIIDPSDPSDVDVVGEYVSTSSIVTCFAIADTVYTSGGKFSVVDAGAVSALGLVGEFSSVFDALDIFVKPPYAYLAEANYGLSIVDITNPAAPIGFERYFGLEEYVNSVFVDRWNRLFMGTDEALMVFRFEGDSIEELGTWTAPAPVLDIEVDGIYAFLACGASGLRILDISNPTAMSEVGYYVLGSELTDITLDYPRAWLVGFWARVNCFDISSFAPVEEHIPLPETPSISVYPSPFNSVCAFDGPECRAIITDISGCKIDEVTIPGTWIPNDDIPSGIYFVIPIDSGQINESAKAILLR